MSICYIVGPMSFKASDFNPSSSDLIIAADAGYNTLKKLNINPNYIIGDFDSLGEPPPFENVIRYSTEKDDTDLLLSVKKALELGFNQIRIFGAIGGRIDHTIANIQILSYIKENGATGYIISEDENITVIEKEKLLFSKNSSGTISLFSLSDTVEILKIEGLKYSLEKTILKNSFPVGISNEFIGKEACVSIKKGYLCVIWSGSIDKTLIL